MAVLEHTSGRCAALLHRHLIGRDATCDLVLDNPSVSGLHACLHWREGSWFVQDLGSRNGTAVGGAAVPPGTSVALAPGALLTFGVEGGSWSLRCDAPPGRAGAAPATVEATLRLSGLVLCFAVSQDEEYVEWSARSGARVVTLGARSFNYPLLILARARLEDAALPELLVSSHGWRDRDAFADSLAMEPETLKVYLHRARQALGAAGVEGAAGLIERRTTAAQLRLGVGAIEIRRV